MGKGETGYGFCNFLLTIYRTISSGFGNIEKICRRNCKECHQELAMNIKTQLAKEMDTFIKMNKTAANKVFFHVNFHF